MADIIDLAEGVAAEIGDGAEVMFAPEFDLKGIKERRIVVVPAGIETKPNARDYLEDRLKVQVGLLPPEASLLARGASPGLFSVCTCLVSLPLLTGDTCHIGLGPTLRTSCDLKNLSKGPGSKYHHILWY